MNVGKGEEALVYVYVVASIVKNRTGNDGRRADTVILALFPITAPDSNLAVWRLASSHQE